MSMVRWNKINQMPSVLFNTFFDDFLGKENYGRFVNNLTVPSVNVVETNENFKVELAVPGYKKEDFKVSIENNVLKISSETEKQIESEGKQLIKEYHYSSFERSFSLPDTIQLDRIEAKYEDGILQLVLPKKEEAKLVGPRTIAIA
ncbi:MAG: Hsp20/alpha crystallin family protein [Cytophagales bacterium]